MVTPEEQTDPPDWPAPAEHLGARPRRFGRIDGASVLGRGFIAVSPR
ncbi:hypothetical protein WME90_22550 [Sorangium sp. So ce375]